MKLSALIAYRFLLIFGGFTMVWAEPSFARVDVFTAGTEGYYAFRIPTLVTTLDGTLISFAEGRKENLRDPGGGDIDLVYKRSLDQGKSWSSLMVLDDPGEKWAASNPASVVDRTNARVWVVYNRWEPLRGGANSKPNTTHNTTWVRHSDNHGKTWSPAREITHQVRDFKDWAMTVIGPGGAIQSQTGRLLIPASMGWDTYRILVSIGDFEGEVLFERSFVIYSDDHGESWKRGELVRTLTDENQLVELVDGAIMIDARQGSGSHRWVAISQDGGQTWSRPRPGQTLPPVATSIERFSVQEGSRGRNRILWTGPAGPGRLNLVVRVSYDEGQTFVGEKVLYEGLAAYSDMSILKNQTVGVLFERGLSENYQFISFTRFSREFLESPSHP